MKSLLVTLFFGAAYCAPSPAPSPFYKLNHFLSEKFLDQSDSTLAKFPDQLVESCIDAAEITCERNLYVVRNGSELLLNGKRWSNAGANVYWLGLDENVVPPSGEPYYAPYHASYPSKGRITEVMNILNTLGARTIRSQTLGISVGNPLSLEPELDVWNDEAFDTIDWTVYQAREHGIRLFAPLTDNYDYYHGGKCVFLRWRGYNLTCPTLEPDVMQFYTNNTIIDDFKNYISHLLTHVNKYTGLTYAEDPTIIAYATGNELSAETDGEWSTAIPNEWTKEIAKHIKSLGPEKLVIDGTFGVNSSHLTIDEVDAYNNHYYPPNADELKANIELVGTANKVFFADEYDWTGNNPDGSTLKSFYDVIDSYQEKSKPIITGDNFWSLFGHDVPNCNIFVNHTDGYTMHFNDPSNTVHNNTQIGYVRDHLFRMKNEEPTNFTGSIPLPLAPCPGALTNSLYS